MAIYNINMKEAKLNFGKDNIITQNYIAGIPGGRALDVTDYALDVIFAGTPVVKNAAGNYKPFPVTSSVVDGETVYTIGSLPEGYSYAGILYKSLLKTKPTAAIMTEGQVNLKALYVNMDSILTAVKAALPLIEFIEDEVATA